MSSPSVLHVISSTDRRGAELFALDLDAALLRRGWRSRVVALAPGAAGGLQVEVLGPSVRSARTLHALRRAAREADVVIAHGSSTLPACALALLGTRVPFVYRNIGDPAFWASTPLRRARVRWFLGRAAIVVAVAQGAERQLTDRFGVGASRVRTIPNGAPGARNAPVDAEHRRAAREALGLAPGTAVVVVVSALSPEKDVALAIEGIGARPDFTLLVAGDGPERGALEELASERAPGRVRFLGSLPDPGPAYEAADVLLLPSRTEGLPAVLIEAGLRALPAVVTDVGYVRDVVVDDETGVIVPAGDVDAIAAGLDRALEHRDAFGRAGRDRCLRRFEIEPVADRWIGVLDAVSARSPR